MLQTSDKHIKKKLNELIRKTEILIILNNVNENMI